ncbi:MAG TPA: reverse transcriptase domain-containing protein, partial [Bacteroidales bacterium]|nr:reverse transcriptase domain-containing protein [Bacteroidales bacterium]
MRNNQSSLRELQSCPVQFPGGTGSTCHRTSGLSGPETLGCTADEKDELSLQIPTPVCDGVQLRRVLPTLKDRAMQTLYAIALEPFAEAKADPNSYGFRPRRSCNDAIAQCFLMLCRKVSAEWIFEADIKACFDEISHKWMIDNLPVNKSILKKWLKAGY